MPFKLTGQLQMQGILKKVASRMPVAAKESLLANAEELLEEMKDVTPEDTGALVDSGQVKVTNGLKVEITFGDTATEAYIMAIHEHPSQYDPPSWVGKDINWQKPGSGPQFMRNPLIAAVDTLPRSLAQDLNLEHLL